MSNLHALKNCEDLVEELEKCRSEGLLQRMMGGCYDIERELRLCRHLSRKEDRRAHVVEARERRQKLEEVWRKRQEEEEER